MDIAKRPIGIRASASAPVQSIRFCVRYKINLRRVTFRFLLLASIYPRSLRSSHFSSWLRQLPFLPRRHAPFPMTISYGLASPQILGALEIGIMFSLVMFGVIALQAYTYFTQNCSTDRRWLKLFVGTVMFFELCHSVASCHALYYFTIVLAGVPEELKAANSYSLSITPVFETIITALIQCFFAFRIRILSGSLRLSVLCWALAVVRLGAGLTMSVVCLLDVPLEPNNYYLVETFGGIITAALVVGVVLDVIITIGLCVYIRRLSTSPTKMPDGSQQLVRGLISWAIETGLITSLTSVTVVITLDNRFSAGIWLALYTFLAKLYSNSLLVSLNARARHREYVRTGSSDPALSWNSAQKLDDVNEATPAAIHQESKDWAVSLPAAAFSPRGHENLEYLTLLFVSLVFNCFRPDPPSGSPSAYIYTTFSLAVLHHSLFFSRRRPRRLPSPPFPSSPRDFEDLLLSSPCRLLTSRAIPAPMTISYGLATPEILGALEIGVMLSLVMFGVILLQAYTYFTQNCSADSRWLKIFVGVVMFLELGHSVAACHALYYFTISLAGMPEELKATNSYTLSVTPVFETIITASIQVAAVLASFLSTTDARRQGFFAFRIWVLSGSLRVSIVCWVIAAIRLATGLMMSTFSLLDVSREPNSTYIADTYGDFFTAALVMGVALDVVITIGMCACIRRLYTTPVELPNGSKQVVRGLICWVIETGLITSLTSLAVVITFQTMKHNWVWLGLYTVLAKLYSNSLLVSLNARARHRESVRTGGSNLPPPPKLFRKDDGDEMAFSTASHPRSKNWAPSPPEAVFSFKGYQNV
ncbi:unnamed protein product [Mycena citricolor]|uniref:DUF6534 domain-containing protein n=1 Tax=Mycena citricolor TaxID=2018698 RepID=A0AAD2K780_9AGAR|nr:unnamed protein product [Mycena citricolor]